MTEVGIATDTSLEFQAKAESPIEVIDDGISIDTREAQLQKEQVPIDVSDVGIVICVILAC